VPHIKFRRPSPAMVVALAALFVAMGGSAVAATQLLIHTKDIANGAVTNRKLANGAIGLSKLIKPIRSELLKAGSARGIVTGPRGGQGLGGTNGKNGGNGSNGNDGRDGANPGVAVVNVPSIASSSGKNPNPDSGDPGDGGWYFSGNSSDAIGCPTADCTAALAGGELRLSGPGTDRNTLQGGVGIAKVFNNVPLSKLDTLAYDYVVTMVKGSQTPIVHVTVSGLTADSHFASGFANLVYAPALNNGNATPGLGQVNHVDGFAPGMNRWYSTTQPNINDQGGQNSPQPLSFFISNNPNAVIGQVSLDNGGSSGANGAFAAGADSLVLGISGDHSFTRYDFGG
jgi:hypothetical protein